MSQGSMVNDLTRGSVAKQLLVFAYPFALSNILQLGYNLADMIIIGQYVGSAGLSGVSIGSEIMTLCTFICMGFANAGQIMISQFVGAGQKDAVRRCIGTMFSFILTVSIVMTIAANLMIDTAMGLMNTPQEAYDYARSYTFTCVCGMFFIYGYNIVSAILRGMGDSKRPFVFIAVASVTNIVLDLLFVAVLKWDAMGAALATVLGQAVSFIGSLIYLYKRREAFGFDFKYKSFRIDITLLKSILRLGVPMALQSSAITISMMFVNSSINSYGVIASAVTGIGNKLRGVSSVVTQSISMAASSMIGQNMGAGKTDRVRSIVRTAFLVDIVFWALISTVFMLFPEAVFGLFSDDAEVLSWASQYMLVCAVCFLTFATMSPFTALINGTGFAALSFVIGILDGVVARVGLAYILGELCGFGIVGYWYGNALAGFVTSGLAAAYYLSGKWKKRKLLISN